MTPRTRIALDVLRKIAMFIGVVTAYAVTAFAATVASWWWFLLEDKDALIIGLLTPAFIVVLVVVLFQMWDNSRRKIEAQDRDKTE